MFRCGNFGSNACAAITAKKPQRDEFFFVSSCLCVRKNLDQNRTTGHRVGRAREAHRSRPRKGLLAAISAEIDLCSLPELHPPWRIGDAFRGNVGGLIDSEA